MRIEPALAAITIMLSLLALPVHAVAPPPKLGAIYLTDQILDSTDLNGANLARHYNMTTARPQGSEASRVYFSQVLPVDIGNAQFRHSFHYVAEKTFTLTTAPLEFGFWLGCDAPSPLVGLRILFLKRDAFGAATTFPNDPAWPAPAPFACLPTSNVEVKVQTHPSSSLSFGPGESLEIHVFPQGLHTDRAPTLFVLVNSTGFPSALTGPGLPRDSPHGRLPGQD